MFRIKLFYGRSLLKNLSILFLCMLCLRHYFMYFSPWYCFESVSLAVLYYHGCFSSLCASCWINCSCQAGPLFDNWTKAIKYLIFGVWIGFSFCIDSCYNKMKVVQQACGEDGVKSCKDIIKNVGLICKKTK